MCLLNSWPNASLNKNQEFLLRSMKLVYVAKDLYPQGHKGDRDGQRSKYFREKLEAGMRTSLCSASIRQFRVTSIDQVLSISHHLIGQ
jgi:hypothetical protein